MDIKDFIRHRMLKRPHRLVLRINQGQGKPLLLVHGLASDSDAWKPLVKFADQTKWHIIAFDLLGFGHSPKPNWLEYSVDQHVRSLVVSIKNLKLKQPATVIGHSMGCLVAIQLAAKYPRLVDKLVLYEPPLFIDAPEYRGHLRKRKRYFSIYNKVAENPRVIFRYTKALGKLATRMPGGGLSAETWLPFERSLRNTVIDQDAYSQLLNINKPITIVYGRMDMIVSRAEIKKIFQNYPNISIHTINATHYISARSARNLLEFIDN